MLKTLYLIIGFISGTLSGQCPVDDEYCQWCIGTYCNYCVYTQADAEGICRQPSKVVDGCYSYNPDGSCMECDGGRLQSLEGLCVPLTLKNAETCYYSDSSISTCTRCMDSFITINGKCPSKMKCQDKNCEVCYFLGIFESCFVCKPGFFLLGSEHKYGKCSPMTPETVGCYFSNSTSYCIDCDIGYYFSNSICKPTTITQMAVTRLLMSIAPLIWILS